MAAEDKTWMLTYQGILDHKIFGKIRFVKFNLLHEPWFVAVDVCKVLGIKNSRDVLAKQIPDDEKKIIILNAQGVQDKDSTMSKNGVTNSVDTIYGITDAICSNDFSSKNSGWIENRISVINEPGLYRLIFMSRKPEAERIKRVVFHEILPSIRKYGYYVAPEDDLIKVKGKEHLEFLQTKVVNATFEVKDTRLVAEEDDIGALHYDVVYEVAVHYIE